MGLFHEPSCWIWSLAPGRDSESFLLLLCFPFLDGNKDSCRYTEASLTFINFLRVPGSNLSPFHLLALCTFWKDVWLFYLLGEKRSSVWNLLFGNKFVARSQITWAQLCSLLFCMAPVEAAELSWVTTGSTGGWDLVAIAWLFLYLLGRACARVAICPITWRTEILVSPLANSGLIHMGCKCKAGKKCGRNRGASCQSGVKCLNFTVDALFTFWSQHHGLWWEIFS